MAVKSIDMLPLQHHLTTGKPLLISHAVSKTSILGFHGLFVCGTNFKGNISGEVKIKFQSAQEKTMGNKSYLRTDVPCTIPDFTQQTWQFKAIECVFAP